MAELASPAEMIAAFDRLRTEVEQKLTQARATWTADLVQSIAALRSSAASRLAAVRRSWEGAFVEWMTQLRTEVAMRTEVNERIDALHAQLRSLAEEWRVTARQAMTRAEMMTALDDVRRETRTIFEHLESYVDESMARAVRLFAEETRRQIVVIDEQYRDLPERQAALRAEFDAHIADSALHLRAMVPAKRRTRPVRKRTKR